MLSRVEHEKSFIISGTDFTDEQADLDLYYSHMRIMFDIFTLQDV